MGEQTTRRDVKPAAEGAALRARITRIAVVCAALAALAATGVAAGHSAYREARAAVTARESIVAAVEGDVLGALADDDAGAADGVLALLAASPGVAAAGVLRADGSLLAAVGDPGLLSSERAGLQRTALRPDDAGFRDAPVGELVLAPSAASSVQARLADQAMVIGFALAFALAAAGAVAAFLGGMAAAPFERALRALREDPARGGGAAEDGAPRELQELTAIMAQLARDARDGEAAVANLIEELRDARERADAASSAKTRFLAHMSHELRTPLNAIMGYTKFVIEDLEGPEHAQQRDDLERVDRASRHLLDLINQVLDLSKVEAGNLSLDLAGFDVGTLVREVIETSAPLAAQSGTDLELHECPRGEVITSDSLRLRQCLINVVGNALKFTQQGRVDVRAWVEKTQDGRRFFCEVKDTGPGIPEDRVEAVFEPFVQVEGEGVHPNKGAGLGLAITKKLCVAMDGDVTCRSALGKGSVFTVSVGDMSSAHSRQAA